MFFWTIILKMISKQMMLPCGKNFSCTFKPLNGSVPPFHGLMELFFQQWKQGYLRCILIRGLMQAPKKHLVGLRVWSSVVHYIACGGGKFEICNYDIDLEMKEKNRSPVLLWVLIWLLLCWWKNKKEGGHSAPKWI